LSGRKEFKPQEKVELASFEINPRVIEIDEFEKSEIKPILEIEVPPPPPTIGVIQTAEVKLPKRVVAGKKNTFVMTDIIFDSPIHTYVDKENPTPLVRIPPVFPNRFLQGDVSGYCKIRFDVSPEGQPMNVQTTLCTNSQLKSATVKSVQKWKYSPRSVEIYCHFQVDFKGMSNRIKQSVIAVLSTVILAISAGQSFAKDNTRSFSPAVGETVNVTMTLAESEDYAGALEKLRALIKTPDLTPYERGMIYQMMGQYNYELDQLALSLEAFENALKSGGLLPEERDNIDIVIAQLMIICRFARQCVGSVRRLYPRADMGRKMVCGSGPKNAPPL